MWFVQSDTASLVISGSKTGSAPVVADLARVLEIEDVATLLEIRCPSTGVLAWPTIRGEFFRTFIGDMLYPSAPWVDLRHRRHARASAWLAIRSALHNRGRSPQPSDVLLFASGAGRIPQGDRTYNRYVDYFADSIKAPTWTLEGVIGDKWPSAKRVNQRVSLTNGDRFSVAVSARLSMRTVHKAMALDMVDIVEQRGRSLFGWDLGDARRESLVGLAARRLASREAEDRMVRKWFGATRPRLVVAEEASYGHMAVFNSVARELDVTVAEFQHGMVTRGHDAYNVSPLLAASPAYQRTQPTAFLAYGTWWNDQFNAPIVVRTAIGNPHRTEVLRAWRPEPTQSTILVLGDGVETARYLALCSHLAKSAGSALRVRFRPHPLERRRVDFSTTTHFEIDKRADLYDSLAAAYAVVGEASTALFEAVGLVERVCVWDTAKSQFFLGNHPFEIFNDPDNLLDALSSGPPPPAVELPEATWAADWRDRFVAFVAEHV